jgi:DNA-binding NtrC family response regulator
MDDQEGIRTMLADMLKELGCEVTVSCDGYEAIDKYQFARNEGRPFHTVILDLTVPGGMGGEETFKVLRKIDPAVKVIVTSGYTKSPMIQHASRYGFVGAIKKPYRLEQLSKSLFEVFAKENSELSL